jgi:hypothetical protein
MTRHSVRKEYRTLMRWKRHPDGGLIGDYGPYRICRGLDDNLDYVFKVILSGEELWACGAQHSAKSFAIRHALESIKARAAERSGEQQ